LKNFIFWDITPSSLFKINSHFGGTYRAYLQSLRVSQEGTSLKQAASFLGLHFSPEDGGDMSIQNFG
jgi:hypothetical protein